MVSSRCVRTAREIGARVGCARAMDARDRAIADAVDRADDRADKRGA